MTPQLTAKLNEVISGEETMRLLEQHHMNQAHVEAYNGFKRWHRYRAMDRGRHSLKLQCYIAENYHMEPMITVNYTTPTNGVAFVDSLKMMHDKSITQLELVKSTCNMAFSENELALATYLEMMITDQTKEIDEYYRLWKESGRPGADMNYLSHELHKKMKCKEEKHFGYKSDKRAKY